MLNTLIITASFVLGGLGRRVAGGAFQQWTGKDIGDLPVRLFFGACIALAALLAGATWWVAAFLILAIWAGTTIPLFGGLGMGRSGNDYWQDFGGMTAHGALGMSILMIPAPWLHINWLPLWLAGLSISPLYTVGWSLTHQLPNGSREVAWLPYSLKGGSEVGEVLWGGAVGIGTALAVMLS
jgi:hypothetical protein